jgi:hypothetical protein
MEDNIKESDSGSVETNMYVQHEIHVRSPMIDEITAKQINELKKLLHDEPLHLDYKSWCTDDLLHRFLVARRHVVLEANELLLSALKFRTTRIPGKGILELSGNAEWEANIEEQGKTGSIYIAENFDKWGRPILLLDNTVQTSTCVVKQQIHLSWNLDLACCLMPPSVDKYVVWINLENFSIFNCPPFSSSTETVKTLCTCYPERLGHLIIYQPTMLLYTVFSAVKYLLDAKTLSKVHFISGKHYIIVIYY